MIQWALIGWSLLSVIFTTLPFLKWDHWWIRGFDFPRVQLLFFILFNIVALLLFGDWNSIGQEVFLFLIILCLIYQTKIIFPYTTLAKKESLRSRSLRKDTRISIVTANVLSPNRRSNDLLRIIHNKDPDLILAVEVDAWWNEALQPLESEYPYIVKETLENLYGMHLYSRFELIDPQIKFLVEEDIPSIHTRVRLPSGTIIQLYGLHPRPPSPTENSMATERDAELLIVGRQINRSQVPIIVAGDLNDVAWSYTTRLFLKISGLLDPRRGRGFYNTFNAKFPVIRWPLDHFFHTNNFLLISLERLPYFGSDHFPISITLNLEPIAEIIQEEPEADIEEKKLASNKIEKVDPIDDLSSRK